jgi:hypothetical protein
MHRSWDVSEVGRLKSSRKSEDLPGIASSKARRGFDVACLKLSPLSEGTRYIVLVEDARA